MVKVTKSLNVLRHTKKNDFQQLWVCDVFFFSNIKITPALDCLVSLAVLSATATLEVLGSNPRSSKVLLGFSMKFSVAARS